MQRDAILNRVRRVVGLPLLATTVGCASQSPSAPATKDPSVVVTAFAGDSDSPLASYLNADARRALVVDCLERFPRCGDLCDTRNLVEIQDQAHIADKQLTPTHATFHLLGEPSDCDAARWEWTRIYDQSGPGTPFPYDNGSYNGYDYNHRATGSATTGDVLTFEYIGEHIVIPGRPFNGQTAPSSTRSTNRWLVAAQHEHASVASFARHLLEMMSLGAPVTLLQAITRAQQDEVRHTQLCLQRAAQDGVEASLGPLDIYVPIRTTPYEVARGVALEGCINETLAVLAMSSDIALASPDDAALLASIVTDETRHAELAWTSLVWLWPQLSSDEQSLLRQDMNQAIPTRYRRALRPIVRALAA